MNKADLKYRVNLPFLAPNSSRRTYNVRVHVRTITLGWAKHTPTWGSCVVMYKCFLLATETDGHYHYAVSVIVLRAW